MTGPFFVIGKLMRFLRWAIGIILWMLLIIALWHSVRHWTKEPLKPAPATQQTQDSPQRLQTLLMKNRGTYDFYQLTGKGKMTSVTTGTGVTFSSTRIIGTNSFLGITNSGASVFTTGKKSGVPLPISGHLVTVSKNGGLMFASTTDLGWYRLTQQTRTCNEIVDIPITRKILGYAPEPMLTSNDLPIERTMRISPFETQLVIVDHAFFPQIALVNLIERKARLLTAPGFGPMQIHYSPLFLDDGRLLFSVTDGAKWGTVLYDIRKNTYDTFSKNFTDQSFLSMNGKVVLLQSFYGSGSLNIPFGSVTIYGQKNGIRRSEIDALIGTKRRAERIRVLLFEDPKAQILRFRKTIEAADFWKVGGRVMRTGLQKLWGEQKYPTTIPNGTIQILRGTNAKDMKTVKTVPLGADPLTRSFHYERKPGPLLEALEIPLTLVGDIERNRTNAEKKGATYEIVDLWW
ncbi:MAG: hypothetical protein PHE68_01075 [Candidatus Peribacteraceae bacterium]|nr:hypothetical protein [Candidatus Peribacteraceae bacterium]MDD5075225.1 hypothetical protein [Candidatus Peribacteraceae bacterium]